VTVIAASGGPGFLVVIVIGFLFLWLLFVRPQRKRQSQQRQMLNELNVGEEVLTAGGIYGTITHVDEEDDRITLEIAPGLEVEVARRAIAGVTQEPDEDDEDEEADESDEADESEDSEEAGHSEEHEETAAAPETADDSTGAISGGEAPVEENRG
jgi:preprotein translocase subunit YajC